MTNNIKVIDNIDNLSFFELYPGIRVYQNMLSNPQKAYDILLRSESESEGKYYIKEWSKWSVFGRYATDKWEDDLSSIEKNEIFNEEKSLAEEIRESYEKAVWHYFSTTGIEIPENGALTNSSYCKYDANLDFLKNSLTMQYHTDYIISQKDMPGDKFHTTCTFYINDNYEGGDIEFYIDGKIITYKPKGGDILIFPSTEPYWHGVKTITSGNKFFVRSFIMYPYEGSKEWLHMQRRLGAYKWAQMEIERVDNEDHMLYMKDGKIITHDEAHPKRENV